MKYLHSVSNATEKEKKIKDLRFSNKADWGFTLRYDIYIKFIINIEKKRLEGCSPKDEVEEGAGELNTKLLLLIISVGETKDVSCFYGFNDFSVSHIYFSYI